MFLFSQEKMWIVIFQPCFYFQTTFSDSSVAVIQEKTHIGETRLKVSTKVFKFIKHINCFVPYLKFNSGKFSGSLVRLSQQIPTVKSFGGKLCKFQGKLWNFLHKNEILDVFPAHCIIVVGHQTFFLISLLTVSNLSTTQQKCFRSRGRILNPTALSHLSKNSYKSLFMFKTNEQMINWSFSKHLESEF